jgi:hypothetical protein
VLGTPHTAGDFTGAWEFMLAASLLSGLTLAAVGQLPDSRRLYVTTVDREKAFV